MRVRRLNDEGDLMTRGQMFIYERDAIAQTAKTRLKLFLGEYFRDITDGTPWFQKILGKYENLNAVEAILRRRISRTQGIIRIITFDLDFDLDTRELKVHSEVLTEFGILEITS